MAFKDTVKNIGNVLFNAPGTLASALTKVIFGDSSINYVWKDTTSKKLNAKKKGHYQMLDANGDEISNSKTSLFDRIRKNGLNGIIGHSFIFIAKATVNALDSALTYAIDAASWLGTKLQMAFSWAGTNLYNAASWTARTLDSITTKTVNMLFRIGGKFADFISNNQKAITITFWVAAGLAAGTAALATFIALVLPATFAAVVGFSIAGVSIASIAGAGLAAQILVTAGLVVAATAVISAVITPVVALGSYFISLGKGSKSEKQTSENKDDQSEQKTLDGTLSDESKDDKFINSEPKSEEQISDDKKEEIEPVHTTLFKKKSSENLDSILDSTLNSNLNLNN